MYLSHRRLFNILRRLLYTSRNTLCISSDEVVKSEKCKTGILMLAEGGPESAKEIESYLTHMSLDRNLMAYPLQKYLGPFLAKRQASKFAHNCEIEDKKYPNYSWAAIQGQKLVYCLDILSPETAPHMPFIGFQHTYPFIEESLEEMEMYDIERAVAFPLLPHYSCSTTGSSLNRIFKHYEKRREPSKIIWSTIDRWSFHPAFINSFAESIKEGLQKFPGDILEETVIVFSAQSIPLKRVNAGDTYHLEVAASVHHIMEMLGNCNPFIISWQSKQIGPFPWLGPETEDVIHSLESSQHKGILIIPISFTSDNIMTNIGFSDILSKHTKMVHVAECPNDRPVFIKGLAELVSKHLLGGSSCSQNLATKCTRCHDESCSRTKEFFMGCKDTINAAKERSTLGPGYNWGWGQ